MSGQFFDFATLREGSSAMIDTIQELYVDKYPQRLVLPPVKPGFLRNQLEQSPPETGLPITEVIKQTKQVIYPGIMLWQSPRYFGYFPSTVAVTNLIAEMFANAFHSPGFNYSLSPSHTELENITMDWIAQALGLPSKFLIQNEGGGIINNSATESILVSVHVAKRKKMDEVGVEQNPEKIVKFVGYFGEFSFVGNQRCLKLKEIFHCRAAPARYCPKTNNLVIDTQALEKMIEEDVQKGLIPFWYGGTYGTTYSCATDLNLEIIRICKKYGMWLNIDGAYLGSTLICPEYRPDMTLFQHVDSLNLNFSKGLLLGASGNLFYVGDKAALTKSMGGEINFSFYKNEYSGKNNVVDYKDWMFGVARRNNAIKYFYLLKHYGLQKLRQFVRDIIAKAQHVVDRVNKSEIFKMFSTSHFGLVCFQVCDTNGQPNSALTKQLGELVRNIPEGFISPGTFQNYSILRIAIGNPTTTVEILDRYLDVVSLRAKQLLDRQAKQKQNK